MDIQEFKTCPIMGILRGVKADILPALTETLIDSGLKTIEITLNTPGAPDLIRRMAEVAQGRLTIGAGTVLSVEQLKAAQHAGATFVVSPTFVPDVVKYCIDHNLAVFPGALTPQEIFTAWQAGATMVKVFPAKFFGPTYFKEIKGPLNDIELLACGGVNADSLSEFMACGASAVAFGGSIFRKDWLNPRGLPNIAAEIRRLIAAYDL